MLAAPLIPASPSSFYHHKSGVSGDGVILSSSPYRRRKAVSRSPFLLPPTGQYVLAAVCVMIIAYTVISKYNEQAPAAFFTSPIPLATRFLVDKTAASASTSVDAGADDTDTYPRSNQLGSNPDEEIFDEEHQQGVLAMYGRDGDSDPLTNEEMNPYSYPGMTPNESPEQWDYSIVIDCGSKGSRLYIYKWPHRHSPTSIPPFSPIFTKHAWSITASPGISSFIDSPEMTIPHLQKLLEFARNSLSEFRNKWDRTPLYVKATAGMRLIKNLPSRDRIMETMRTFLLTDRESNPFYFERMMARVISGEEEGVYGWMTANYLSGTLMRASSATAFGTLDLGGASVQITFRPPFDVLSNYFPLRIQQEKIRLYSHSFMNFGLDAALQRVNDHIIEIGTAIAEGSDDVDKDDIPSSPYYSGQRDGVRVFRHPCFPLGYTFTYEHVQNEDLHASYDGSGASDIENGIDMSPITIYSAENAKREMVQFEGGQDFETCSALTWQLLHKKSPCFDNTCSFDSVYQPRFGNTTFLAFSQFSKIVVGDLKLPHNATLEQIDVKNRDICATTWQQLQEQHRYAKIEPLARLCFNSRYVFTLLYKGFGFPYSPSAAPRYGVSSSAANNGRLLFVRSILGLDLSWALGSAVYETNAMPWDLDVDAAAVAKKEAKSEKKIQEAAAAAALGGGGGDTMQKASKAAANADQSPAATNAASTTNANGTLNLTQLWGLVGALAGALIATLIAFAFYMRQTRREMRRMEESGLKYEPISEEDGTPHPPARQ